MTRIFCVVVLFLVRAVCTVAQSAPAEFPAVLTLEAAIAEAQQNNRQIKIIDQSVLLANDEILAARTQRYAQFNVQLTGGGLLTAIHVDVPKDSFGLANGSPVPASDSVITTNPKLSAMSVIQVYQPLSQLYSVHLNVELMKVGKKMSQEQWRQQRQQITNSVKDAYYGLLQTQSALEAANESVQALREVDRTTTAYVQEKTVLQTNPVDYPVELRVAGLADINSLDEEKDIRTLRSIAGQVATILRSVPGAARVRDDWGQDGFQIALTVDPDRANMAGVTNQDVANSSSTALSGAGVTTLRRGDQQVPVVSRLRMEERATLSDIQNLYVYSSSSNNKVALIAVSKIENTLQTVRIRHLEHFRTISVQSFTNPGVLPSEVFSPAAPKLAELQKSLPAGYNIVVSGEQAKQLQGFKNLSVIMGISIALIFLALAFQFRHSIKPILVLAAAPYGVAGALIALYLMGSAFGFMAFLGIASLIGVIVSHVIVLFDFIEEMHEKGERLEQALLDAGIVRLRPVLITVGATILALFPLAIHGGPLWQPLCYAQIGGLGVATFITLLLVPVLYSIFVLDLKIVTWGAAEEHKPVNLTPQPKGEIS